MNMQDGRTITYFCTWLFLWDQDPAREYYYAKVCKGLSDGVHSKNDWTLLDCIVLEKAAFGFCFHVVRILGTCVSWRNLFLKRVKGADRSSLASRLNVAIFESSIPRIGTLREKRWRSGSLFGLDGLFTYLSWIERVIITGASKDW